MTSLNTTNPRLFRNNRPIATVHGIVRLSLQNVLFEELEKLYSVLQKKDVVDRPMIVDVTNRGLRLKKQGVDTPDVICIKHSALFINGSS
jgi:hypothetical protein